MRTYIIGKIIPVFFHFLDVKEYNIELQDTITTSVSKSQRTATTINNPSREWKPDTTRNYPFRELAFALFRIGRETLINAIPRYNANPRATIHQYAETKKKKKRDGERGRALGGGRSKFEGVRDE